MKRGLLALLLLCGCQNIEHRLHISIPDAKVSSVPYTVTCQLFSTKLNSDNYPEAMFEGAIEESDDKGNTLLFFTSGADCTITSHADGLVIGNLERQTRDGALHEQTFLDGFVLRKKGDRARITFGEIENDRDAF